MENHMDNKMKTCKDCIHFEVCCYVDVFLPACDSFKDKSKIIELPCAIGDNVYMINLKIDPYAGHEYYTIIQAPFRVSILHLIGKVFFLTREEAEKRLEELT